MAFTTRMRPQSLVGFLDVGIAIRCACVTGDVMCDTNAFHVLPPSPIQCIRCSAYDHFLSTSRCDGVASDEPLAATSAYVEIGLVFVLLSQLVYGLLWLVARCNANDIDNPSLVVRGYRFIYAKVFGSLLSADKKRTRRLSEYWITECQLLDCFWTTAYRERPRRGFSLRLMRLVSSLLVMASISFFLGTLEFDLASSTAHSLCTSTLSTNSSLDDSTMCTPPRRPVLPHLSKTSSMIAFVVTQGVKFIGSYAQNLGQPDSTLDWSAHVVWLVVAATAIPASALLSTRWLHGHLSNISLVLSVTLSAWFQVQIADVIKVPMIYWSKKFGHTMLPNPHEQSLKTRLRLRELDCLGGQHTTEPMSEDDEPRKVENRRRHDD